MASWALNWDPNDEGNKSTIWRWLIVLFWFNQSRAFGTLGDFNSQRINVRHS